jgi:hypothetical protein
MEIGIICSNLIEKNPPPTGRTPHIDFILHIQIRERRAIFSLKKPKMTAVEWIALLLLYRFKFYIVLCLTSREPTASDDEENDVKPAVSRPPPINKGLPGQSSGKIPDSICMQ